MERGLGLEGWRKGVSRPRISRQLWVEVPVKVTLK